MPATAAKCKASAVHLVSKGRQAATAANSVRVRAERFRLVWGAAQCSWAQ